MTLTERIERGPDRRQTDVQPVVDRRLPAWRRRALEQGQGDPHAAVADLTRRAA